MRNFSIDWGLIVPTVILVFIGLTTLFSINTSFFRNQLLFVLLSIGVYLFVSRINMQAVTRYALPVYFVSLGLLLIILLLGVESRGAVRWVGVFGLGIQFSELLKPFLGISLALFLAQHKDRSFASFILVFVLLIPPMLLIAMQPDLGSALIYGGVTLFMLIVFGYPLWWFLVGIVLQIAAFPLFWHFLHIYQQQRILTFIHPTSDPLGTSYNAIQSVIAVGSGSFMGKGLGQGSQSGLRFLPERHTDFIFATLSEGLGFLGTVVVLIAFAFLLYRLLLLFRQESDDFVKNLVAIAFAIFIIQFFINIGMNIGMVPVVGVPLPFVSYGGSSLLANFILLGFVTAATRTVKKHKTLEIR